METLGLDLSDDSLSGTPLRVAKMFVKELFGGLDPEKKHKKKVNRIVFNQITNKAINEIR